MFKPNGNGTICQHHEILCPIFFSCLYCTILNAVGPQCHQCHDHWHFYICTVRTSPFFSPLYSCACAWSFYHKKVFRYRKRAMSRKVFWFFAEGRKCLLFWPIGMYGQQKKQVLLLNVKHFLKNEKNMFYCLPVNITPL